MSDTSETSLSPTAPRVPSRFQPIATKLIVTSRHQARKSFDEESLNALAESIRLEGLQNPITVRQVGEGFELIAGERRLRAVKILGWETVDAKIIDLISEGEAAAKGLIENLQRQDLNPLEEAEGFQSLLDLKDAHWTQEQIARISGKPPSRISESVRLLSLPDAVKEKLRQRKLTREHGVELLRLLNGNSQIGMANKILKGLWSVKKTRAAIDQKLGKSKSEPELTTSTNPVGKPALKDPLQPVWDDVQAQTPAVRFVAEHGKEGHWTFKVSVKKDLDSALRDFGALIGQLGISFKEFVNKR